MKGLWQHFQDCAECRRDSLSAIKALWLLAIFVFLLSSCSFTLIHVEKHEAPKSNCSDIPNSSNPPESPDSCEGE